MSFSSNNHPIPRHPSSLSLKGLLNSNLRKEIFGPQACLGLAGLAHDCLLPSIPHVLPPDRREQVPTNDEAVIAPSHEHGFSLGGQVEVPGSQER